MKKERKTKRNKVNTDSPNSPHGGYLSFSLTMALIGYSVSSSQKFTHASYGAVGGTQALLIGLLFYVVAVFIF
jgi:hypothetical protein